MLGSFRGRVIALGPIIGYDLLLAERCPIELTMKYEMEFAEQNRSSGNTLWFNAAFLL